MTPDERQRLEALAEEIVRLQKRILRDRTVPTAGKGFTYNRARSIERRLRAIAAEAGWISVEDRLPEDEEDVWVPSDNGLGVIEATFSNGQFYYRDWHPLGIVTHWMNRYTPPPPKPEAGRAE